MTVPTIEEFSLCILQNGDELHCGQIRDGRFHFVTDDKAPLDAKEVTGKVFGSLFRLRSSEDGYSRLENFNRVTGDTNGHTLPNNQTNKEEIVSLQKPSIDLLSESLYQKDPEKLNYLREDVLHELLHYSNAAPGSRVAVVDFGTMKLVTAALVRAVGPTGRVVDVLLDEPSHNGTALALMDFTSDQLNPLTYFKYEKLSKMLPPDFDKNSVDIPDVEDEKPYGFRPLNKSGNIVLELAPCCNTNNAVSEAVLNAGVHSLVIANAAYPVPSTLALVPFLFPGSPIAVFSFNREPLSDLFESLKEAGFVGLRISEPWIREYKITEGATHPKEFMSSSGGFLLTGTKTIKPPSNGCEKV